MHILIYKEMVNLWAVNIVSCWRGLWGLWIVDIASISILPHNWIPQNAHIRCKPKENINWIFVLN